MAADPPADLRHGAFSLDPPWLIEDPAALPWRAGLDRIRVEARVEMALLAHPRRLPPGVRVAVVGADIGAALAAWRLVERRSGDRSTSRAGLSRRLRRSFERLGPTFIKLGQVLSSGEGIFPEELVAEMRHLRDQVPAETFASVRRIVEEDLGRPLEEVFVAFAEEPLAAASIAQVHAAVLRTGERVVVKVQRPTVARLVRADVAAMAWLAPLLIGRIPISTLANPPALVDLFAETIAEELDFRLEAENMLDVARVLAAEDQRAIVVPRPHPQLVTQRVLVMERLDGFAFHDVEGMRAAGVDTEAVVRAGMVGVLEGLVLHGVFHGDLHGGNLFVQPDGKVALLDFGITGRLDERRRLAFLRLLMGGTVNDVRMQLAALRDLGALPDDVDLEQVVVDLGLDGPPMDPTQMSADELLNELREITKKLLGYGARMPKELMLFVKDMLFLDGAIATLAPDLDLLAEITSLATWFASRHGDRIMRDVGIDPRDVPVDLTGFKSSIGIDPSVERLTHRQLRERRELISRRMEERSRRR